MGSDLDQLRAQIDHLGRQLSDMQRRVTRLEAGAVTAPLRRARAPHPFPGQGAGAAEAPPVAPLAGGMAALIGRTSIVLAGAYLFRALSDRAVVPPLAGATAAWLYALVWLVLCDRAAAGGRRTSALFHGITGTLIAYPLLWETTVVFGLLPAAVASLGMLVVLGLALGVAAHRTLLPLAWIAVLAHQATGFGVMLGAGALLPVALALLAAAAAVELPRIRDRWPALRWPAALGADGVMLVLVVASLRASRDPIQPVAPDLVVAGAVLALPLVMLGSVAERVVQRARTISPFEIVQVAFSLLVGLGGGAAVLAARGTGPAPIGALALLLGAACHAVAFAAIGPRLGRGRSFHVFATFGVLLMLAGPALLWGSQGVALVAAWCALGVAALGWALREQRLTLRFHAAVYLIAAVVASRLPLAAGDGMLAGPDAWRPWTFAMFAVLCVMGLGCVALMARPLDRADALARLPQAGLAALLVLLIAGLAARSLAPLAFAGWSDEASLAGLAALRSLLIAGFAVALAVLGRRFAAPELDWLVYPLLALGGVKLLWEDLRVGDPIALFVALAGLGSALLVAPRLLRRAPATPAASGPADSEAA